jgi:type II secretory pathway predicted ATPase ExeA
MGNVWEDLGFTGNPYDPRALSISDEDRKLLINRIDELRMLTTLSNSGRGIIIVEGGVGVGKTSLVNAMQYDLLHQKKNKILPAFQKIELTNDNIEPKNFILSTFSNMIFSLEKLTNTDLAKQTGILKEGKLLVAQTIQSGFAGSLQAFGFGGGMSRSPSTSQPAAVTLPAILNTMDKWVEYVSKNTEYDGPAVIPVNNMDVLDDKEIVSFLNSMRDTIIERPHIVWILIGRKGLFSLLESEVRRVSEIITGQPVVLQPLTLQDVYNAIKVRIELLSQNKKGARDGIVSDEIVKILYDASQGEIRYVFKRITDIILKFRGQFPSVSKIPLDAAKSMIIDFAKSRIDALNLSQKEIALLKNIVKRGSMRTREYQSVGLQTPQALNKYLTGFYKQNLVVKEYGEGRAVYYRPTADTIFALQDTTK